MKEKYKIMSSFDIILYCNLNNDEKQLLTLTSTRRLIENLISWFKYSLNDFNLMCIETDKDSFRRLQKRIFISFYTNRHLNGKIITAAKLNCGDKVLFYVFAQDDTNDFMNSKLNAYQINENGIEFIIKTYLNELINNHGKSSKILTLQGTLQQHCNDIKVDSLLMKNRDSNIDIKKFCKIPNFNNYCVSKEGVVINTNKKVMKTRNRGGYEVLTLYRDNKNITVSVHRLVAEAFIGDIPDGYVVNHKDGSKHNNVVENLEIVTYQENISHAAHVLQNKKKGDVKIYVKETDETLEFITINMAEKAIFGKETSTFQKMLRKKRYENDKYIILEAKGRM